MRNEIVNLLNSDITGYRIFKVTGISQSVISELRLGKRNVGKLTLDTAEKLANYYNKLEENKMYKLTAMEEGQVQSQETFATFNEVKEHLIETDYFSWINEQEPDRELPKFEDVEDIKDIEIIFEEYDYSWWTMKIEEINKGDEK